MLLFRLLCVQSASLIFSFWKVIQKSRAKNSLLFIGFHLQRNLFPALPLPRSLSCSSYLAKFLSTSESSWERNKKGKQEKLRKNIETVFTYLQWVIFHFAHYTFWILRRWPNSIPIELLGVGVCLLASVRTHDDDYDGDGEMVMVMMWAPVRNYRRQVLYIVVVL